MTNEKKVKVETVEEYLARGGKITVVPPQEYEEKEVNVRKTTSGPANIMTLQEGALLFSEKIERKKKVKTIDKAEVDKQWDSLNDLDLSDEIKKKLGL